MAKTSKNKYSFIQKIDSDTDIEAYLPRLNINSTISAKMKLLCQISALSKDDINNRQRILDYLRSLFLPFYPDSSLIAFGSTNNGFGTKGCDMDVMFSPSSDFEHLDASEINDKGNAPTLFEVRENPSVMAQLKNMSKEKQLRFLLKVIRRKANKIQHAVYIPAKCPILRFLVLHDYYHLWCDLSFQHGLAKSNTELLHFFSVLDNRVKPLMITLRFWAKHLKIAGTGAFSSYAFSLLVIFFLQNLEEPILPSVTDLMINAESHVFDGWEAGFVSDAQQQKFISRNTLSEEELLNEFFRFYWNFDFVRYVVCIRTGKAKPISDFSKDTDERMKPFKIADVCVQDPFNLSHNVASSVNLSRLRLLKPYFFVADLILSKQTQSFVGNDTFQLLFDVKLYEDLIHEHFFFRKSYDSECFYIFPSFEFSAGNRDNFERIWFEQVPQAVRDILDFIFFFDCEVIDKNCSVKDANCDDDYSESEQKLGKLLLSIQCGVDNRLWKYRNTKIKKDVSLDSYGENFDNKVLKEHNAISHFLLASNPGVSPEPFIWFLCNIHQSRYSQLPFMCIVLVPLSNTETLMASEFKSLCNMLKGFIPPTVKKMLINQCV